MSDCIFFPHKTVQNLIYIKCFFYSHLFFQWSVPLFLFKNSSLTTVPERKWWVLESLARETIRWLLELIKLRLCKFLFLLSSHSILERFFVNSSSNQTDQETKKRHKDNSCEYHNKEFPWTTWIYIIVGRNINSIIENLNFLFLVQESFHNCFNICVIYFLMVIHLYWVI